MASSQAGFIADSISNVVQSLVFGGILAFLVLFLFLRDPRYPVAIALAIPISVVGTFALMEASGVSLNIMSLGGLALGVGMLVDNSIVVLENIFRHREEDGEGRWSPRPRGRRRCRGPSRPPPSPPSACSGPSCTWKGWRGSCSDRCPWRWRSPSSPPWWWLSRYYRPFPPASGARRAADTRGAGPDVLEEAVGFWRKTGRRLRWLALSPILLLAFLWSVVRQLVAYLG